MIRDPNIKYLFLELVHNLKRLNTAEEIQSIDEIVNTLDDIKYELERG